jgi:putative hydrolase of the HAD superfamily
VLDGLDRLRAAGWAVGIVTNGMTDNQTGKIERTGLASRVDGWAISGAEGVRKPDARLFEIAAGRCGAPLRGGWMVGDDPAKDIDGGRRAGLRTIWIDRGRAATEPAADQIVTGALAAVELLIEMKPAGPGR